MACMTPIVARPVVGLTVTDMYRLWPVTPVANQTTVGLVCVVCPSEPNSTFVMLVETVEVATTPSSVGIAPMCGNCERSVTCDVDESNFERNDVRGNALSAEFVPLCVSV